MTGAALMSLGRALVIQGDALHLPLPDESVDLIVTSPPYWSLRAYGAGPEEIGSEPTPQQYLEALWAATQEMARCLKPTGSIFCDLGDKYNAYNGSRGDGQIQKNDRRPLVEKGHGLDAKGIPPKSLLLLPERYRIGCVDQLGLIARAVIVWDKANSLPESVGDRVRRSHEDWVHLTKNPRYYSAVDEIRESHSPVSIARSSRNRFAVDHSQDGIGSPNTIDPAKAVHPLGKLPGSVWGIEESIWDGPINFCPRCGRGLAAGNGRAGRTETVTVSNGSPAKATAEPTEPPTNSSSDPSLTASSSTTSAATPDASTPSTSNPSPSARISPEGRPSPPSTLPRPTASTATSSPPPTPTAGLEVGNARCVCETVCGSDAPGSVWRLASEPLRLPEHLGVQHYAAFPSEWPRRLILGFSPPGICVDCNQGRVPVVDRQQVKSPVHSDGSIVGNRDGGPDERGWDGLPRFNMVATILGYACSCTPYADHPGTPRDLTQPDRWNGGPQSGGGFAGQARDQQRTGPWREYHLDGWKPPPTRPSVILDPFSGVGTTIGVAKRLGRIGVGVDLSGPYCRAAKWRVNDPDQFGKAEGRSWLGRQGSLL